jgi:hypothetical protein
LLFEVSYVIDLTTTFKGQFAFAAKDAPTEVDEIFAGLLTEIPYNI